MEIAINIDGRMVSVEVSAEVVECLDAGRRKSENLSHERRRYWDKREFDEYIIAAEGRLPYCASPEELVCQLETWGEIMAVLAPEELMIQAEDEAAADLMLEHLAGAMLLLSPVQVRRLHARYALKKKFREIAADEGVSGSSASASVDGAVKKLRKIFVKNGWLEKED